MTFLSALDKYIQQTKFKNLILIGDFNIVENRKDVKTGQHITTSKQTETLLQEIIRKHRITDIYRYLNPNKIIYTHISATQATRLDRIYISNGKIKQIKNTHIKNSITDHKSVEIEIIIAETNGERVSGN